MSSYDFKLAKYYDSIYQKKDYKSECDLILKFANCDSKLLDVGCGTLGHTIILSKIFKEIVAIDLSTSMIDVGRQKLLNFGIENVKVLNCDLAHLENEESFDIAISMFNVVNHIRTLKEVESFFQLISKSLKSDGIFIFDCWNGVACIREIPNEISNKEIELKNFKFITITNTSTDLMKAESVMKTEVKVLENSIEVDSFSYDLVQKLWIPNTLQELLENSGLSIVKIIPFFNDSRCANFDDYRITFICKKKR